MNEQDRKRFGANIQWFNQFFEGIRNIYDMVLEDLPAEYFPARRAFTSENYYFPRQKIAPSIPSYYALLVEGFKYALQILTVVDVNLISRSGYFIFEPSIIIVAHNQPEKSSWVGRFALDVIGNKNVEITQKVYRTFWGHITSGQQAEFFTFQVEVDQFSETDNLKSAVHQHIIVPLTNNLKLGFPKPPV